MNIKKPYVELIELLEANKNAKVSSILEKVYLMAESKKQSNTYIKDANGRIIAIFCYYHKQWEILEHTEYGSKKGSTTGYNTMCKVGVSKWTKAQSTAKKAKEAILMGVSKGSIDPKDIINKMNDVEANRLKIDATDMPKGYASEDEVLKHIK